MPNYHMSRRCPFSGCGRMINSNGLAWASHRRACGKRTVEERKAARLKAERSV